MKTYHQIALFDLDLYVSEPPCSETSMDDQEKKVGKEVEFDQLELNLFTKLLPLKKCSPEYLKRAA